MDLPIVMGFIDIKFTPLVSQAVNLADRVDWLGWRLMDFPFMVPSMMMAHS